MDEFTCAHVSVGVCLWMTHITARHFSRHQSSNFSVCWHFGSCLVSVQFCMRSTGRTTNLSPWCSPWTRLCRTWCRQSSNLEEITSWSKWTPREVGKQRKHILCLKIFCVTVNVLEEKQPSLRHQFVRLLILTERAQLKLDATAVYTALGLNERLFICTSSQVDQLVRTAVPSRSDVS